MCLNNVCSVTGPSGFPADVQDKLFFLRLVVGEASFPSADEHLYVGRTTVEAQTLET